MRSLQVLFISEDLAMSNYCVVLETLGQKERQYDALVQYIIVTSVMKLKFFG